MQRRQITLADGRYLIFYTFDESAPAAEETGDHAAADAPTPQPQAEEERHV
jgi:hypothetical protein